MLSCTGWKLIVFSRPNPTKEVDLKRNEFFISYPTTTPLYARDFVEAKLGRGEEGLIITAGRFTTEAKTEANRDVTPIEIIGGNRLVELFEKYR
jgi:hypothetical protein